MKKKLLIFGCLLLWYLSVWADGKSVSCPTALLGNWMNKATHEWEYGFYEDFAVARTGFWNYKTIKEGKKRLEVILENGTQEIHLKIRKTDGKLSAISFEGEPFEEFFLWNKCFLSYPLPDTTSFPQPTFEEDTVTLFGYIRHAECYGKRNFTVSWSEFGEDQREISADIDSLGRFCMKIPVYSSQLIFLDWGKLLRRIVVTPGETLLMYVDAKDLIPTEEDRKDRKFFFQRDRDLLFMGEQARLHNEFTHCPYSFMRDMGELCGKVPGDMAYLAAVRSDYESCVQEMKAVEQKYAPLSRRCLEAVYSGMKYEMAWILMQGRFCPSLKRGNAFKSPEYMAFVDQNFSRDSVLYYFITRDYGSFIRDYTGYMNDQSWGWLYDGVRGKFLKDWKPKALQLLVREGKFPRLTGKECDRYVVLRGMFDRLLERQDTLALQRLLPEKMGLDSMLRPFLLDTRVQELAQALHQQEELRLYDTLLSQPALREIYTANYFMDYLKHDRTTLNAFQLELMEKKISIPCLKRRIMDQNAVYEKLKNQQIDYPESLKNSADFVDITDADQLWETLLAPYRGKAVVVDFWGSWCDPCKEMMSYLAPIKEKLKDQKVVFLYFAYLSPEDSWKNVIKEFRLWGPQVVHYNLPVEQQRLVIRKLGVESYPTLMLIDRGGQIVNPHMPSPENMQDFLLEIQRVLDK